MHEYGDIELYRDVAPGESIISENGSVIVHGDICDNAAINVKENIKARNVGNNVTISCHNKAEFLDIKSCSYIFASKGIITGNVSSKCDLITTSGSINAKKISCHSTLFAHLDIRAGVVSKGCKVTSKEGQVILQSIWDGAIVSAAKSVVVKRSIDPRSRVSSRQGLILYGIGSDFDRVISSESELLSFYRFNFAHFQSCMGNTCNLTKGPVLSQYNKVRLTKSMPELKATCIEQVIADKGLDFDLIEELLPKEKFEDCYCSISLCFMRDPVFVRETGSTYDRKSITDSLAKIPGIDPATNIKIDDSKLIPNISAKNLIITLINMVQPEAVNKCQARSNG